MEDKILLLVGRSGSGKDTVAQYLCDNFGYKKLCSYTTRKIRNDDDLKNHIFVTDEAFDKLMSEENIIAYTEFDGYRYCGTEKQIEENDIYIIDPTGVEFFLNNYKGNKKPVIVYLACDWHLCYNRMKRRKDDEDKIRQRMMNDETKFGMFKNYDVCISADNPVPYIGNFIHNFFMFEHCKFYEPKEPKLKRKKKEKKK